MALLPKDSWRSGRRRFIQFFSESDLYRLLESPKMTMIEWLQERNLIAKTHTCFGCKNRNIHLMKLAVTKKSSDGFRWQCGKFTRSLRRGTWFEGSRLTLQEIILVTFYWCHNAQQQHARRALQTKSFEAVIDWYHNCRKICMEMALRTNEKYGGPGGIVELCENLYSDRKNNRPGKERHPQWIICGIDRRGGTCFMVPIEDKDLETFEKIIRDYILPGTIICTEYSNIYDDLMSLELADYTVVHSTHLLEYATARDKFGVEFSWRTIKRKLLCAGRKSDYIMSYLAEYFYKKSVHKNHDPFVSFLQVIASTYTLQTDLLENQGLDTVEDSAVTIDAGAELKNEQIDTYNPYEISTYIGCMNPVEAEVSSGDVEDSECEQSNRKCSSYGLPLTRGTLDQILELAKNSGCNHIEIKQSGTRKATRDSDVDMHLSTQNVDKPLRLRIFNEDINIAQVNVPSEVDETSMFSDHFDTAMQTDVLIREMEHDNPRLRTLDEDNEPVPIDSSKLAELADHTYFAPVGYVINDHDYL